MNAFIIEGNFSSFPSDFQEELEVELEAELKILDGLTLPKEKALSLINRERFRHQQGQ
ncbi:MAG TPA: hypothetical protein V6D26_06020 [Stenomitos sp.]